jgi:MFS family permease
VGLVLGGLLTEYLSWRWCLYVNLFFAGFAAVGGALLLKRQPPREQAKLDVLGVVLAGSSMFCLVYGFSNAASHTGTRRPPTASWPQACCCWPFSPGGRPARPARC